MARALVMVGRDPMSAACSKSSSRLDPPGRILPKVATLPLRQQHVTEACYALLDRADNRLAGVISRPQLEEQKLDRAFCRIPVGCAGLVNESTESFPRCALDPLLIAQ